MPVTGTNDGWIHRNVDGFNYSFHSVTRTEAAAINRTLDRYHANQYDIKEYEKNPRTCSMQSCNNKLSFREARLFPRICDECLARLEKAWDKKKQEEFDLRICDPRILERFTCSFVKP